MAYWCATQSMFLPIRCSPSDQVRTVLGPEARSAIAPDDGDVAPSVSLTRPQHLST
jgi:hypothetical protein